MQNIDPFLLLEPLLFIAVGVIPVVYWRLKKRFAGVVLLLSLIAYAGAIAAKEVIQYYTVNSVIADFGSVSWQTGIYFGLQTSFLEVGLAYVVAVYAVRRKLVSAMDAESYGVSLGFWENAIVLGALILLNLASTYVLIAENLLPQSVYQTLLASEPSVFYPPQQLAVPIALGTLERFSSFLDHLAWGYLCVMSVCYKRPSYLVVALPMGLLDALVPFAPTVPAWEFELLIFALSLGFVAVARVVTRGDRLSPVPAPREVPLTATPDA